MFGNFQHSCYTLIREPLPLECAKIVVGQRVKRATLERFFTSNDVFNLNQKPGINTGVAVDFLEGQVGSKCIGEVPNAICTRMRQLLDQFNA